MTTLLRSKSGLSRHHHAAAKHSCRLPLIRLVSHELVEIATSIGSERFPLLVNGAIPGSLKTLGKRSTTIYWPLRCFGSWPIAGVHKLPISHLRETVRRRIARVTFSSVFNA